MKIYKTMVAFADSDPGKIFACDTIEINGVYWLVPDWLESHSTGKMKPIRIICLDDLPYQKTGSDNGPDFVLNVPIPKSAFEFGEIPLGTTLNFQIVEAPEIMVDIPKQSALH